MIVNTVVDKICVHFMIVLVVVVVFFYYSILIIIKSISYKSIVFCICTFFGGEMCKHSVLLFFLRSYIVYDKNKKY